MRSRWLLLVSSFVTFLVAIPATITGCGGSSARHRATATPDFSLGVSPATASLTGGAAGQPISVTASAMNGFAAPVTVALEWAARGGHGEPCHAYVDRGYSAEHHFHCQQRGDSRLREP